MTYEFRAYCDICNDGTPWFDAVNTAKRFRVWHFDMDHPDNPMRKENCRIQRRTVE